MDISTIIKKTELKLSLLKELEQSLLYEQCEFHLVQTNKNPHLKYSLYHIESKRNLKNFSSVEQFENYLVLRKIPKSLVFI